MAQSLIRLDGKHISVDLLQMPKDRILKTYIHNLPALPSPLIEPYFRYVRFLHVTFMGKGCKLDPTLVSALVKRWRPKTHTFHIPFGECTITLEDVQLKLELPMDGLVVTGSIVTTDWRDVCEQLLGGWLLKLVYVRETVKLSWGMHPVQILGESQHLVREYAIGSVRYGGDARVGQSVGAVRI
ncbi:hypothetical protein PVK06_011289 [Gossypium arboreum]|uniref:Aminotransferase-like plant mobile domain-containing protein n=1 Tax=Gossypium arboreum TaxID=29729 RepID=A0ABR0Q9B3_GOSAR|nr:hypothetical protein PVK06_011289 [Gossypium arboreum]